MGLLLRDVAFAGYLLAIVSMAAVDPNLGR
jgi:hypothetical protein